MRKFVVVAVIAVAALAGCKKKKEGDGGLPPATGSGAAPLPEIAAIKAGSAATPGSGAIVEAAVSGTLEAREQVEVAPHASGTILSVYVDENSPVKKGQLLFQLDSRDAQLMKKQSMNQLAGAELALKTAQREYDRIKGLVGQNAVPQQQLDQLDSQVEGAKLQIEGAKNSIAMMSKTIGDAAVRSPLSGVVIKKLKSAGEYATMMPPSPVVIVQDQSTLELKFRLPERTLTSLKQGDPVTVTIPSLGQTREAHVMRISPTIDPRTRTVELTAVLDNCDGGLRPGIAAEVALGAAKGEVTAPACSKTAAAAPKGKAKPTAEGRKAP